MMKQLLCIVIITAILFNGCKEQGTKTADVSQLKNDSATSPPITNNSISIDEYLITDTSFGKITPATTYKHLEELFGKNNLKDEIQYGAEGLDSFMVTKIFPNTPKELVIWWQENNYHKIISSVISYNENAPYHTADGLKTGSTLDKLLRVNGKNITFMGTDWDYGGYITSYNNGKFEKSKVAFRLASTPGMDQDLMGDAEFNNDMPLVKNNLQKIKIHEISVLFKK
jgi:hypothetical protein